MKMKRFARFLKTAENRQKVKILLRKSKKKVDVAVIQHRLIRVMSAVIAIGDIKVDRVQDQDEAAREVAKDESEEIVQRVQNVKTARYQAKSQ